MRYIKKSTTHIRRITGKYDNNWHFIYRTLIFDFIFLFFIKHTDVTALFSGIYKVKSKQYQYLKVDGGKYEMGEWQKDQLTV